MKYLKTLIVLFFTILIWSLINPKEYFTWFLEVFPALIGIIVLFFTFKKFRFTNFVYTLIFIHCCILIIGGHYTYAEVPLFDWIKEVFHQSRNNYDKVGHFAQGFVPAFIIREIFIRKNIINNKKWLSFIVVSVCMAISVTYEFIEWFVSVMVGGESADAFLGTQGYIWDSQSDILFATIGAIIGLAVLGKFHNVQINLFLQK